MRQAINFIARALWRWDVTGIGSTLLYGFGVGAMYGDDYIIAGMLYFAGTTWLTARILAWEETKSHPQRGLVSIGILIVATFTLGGSGFWIRHRSIMHAAEKREASSKAKSGPETATQNEPKGEESKKEPPTVETSPNAADKRASVPEERHKIGDETTRSQVTLEIGQSLDPKWAFETRFILTNHSVLPLTNIGYACEIPNGDPTRIMHLDKPMKIGFASVGSIRDLSPGLSDSFYCDFSTAEFYAAKADPLIAQVWISYTYKGKKQREGFRFSAQHKQDGTFAWFPKGAAEEPRKP